MAVPRNRVARFLTDSRPQSESVLYPLSNFYREEFIKCQRCLDAQREYYSDRAISEVQRALTKVLGQLDHLCTTADADEVVSQLLRQFNTIAPPSAWSDPRHTH